MDALSEVLRAVTLESAFFYNAEFAQFYPTLLEIAKKKGTLSGSYLTEEAAGAKSAHAAKK